jgi:Protein kinase domain/AAA-like domain
MSFKIRGSLTKDDQTPYLIREADRELLTLAQKADYIALIGPRMTGKTSMLFHMWETLIDQSRFALCYVNISMYIKLDEARWHQSIYNAMVSTSKKLLPAPDFEIEDSIDFREALITALEESLSDKILIVMMDDIETVPTELRNQFFATLREMFVSRGIQPALRRLAFVLCGSYIPDDLITDSSISPFRVAEKVYIQDADDITPLINHLKTEKRELSEDVPARIKEWTEGDVYLTQKLCDRLDRRYPEGTITPQVVDQVVSQFLYDDEIFENLTSRLRAHPRVLETIYKVVEQETSIRFTRTNRAIAYAWLLGCIKPNSFSNCISRNLIYENTLREIFKRITLLRDRISTSTPHEGGTESKPLHGRYTLETVINRNVLTHIYRAKDLESGKIVAVKQLLSMRGGDIIAWRRFQREGEALRRLNHANIVTLIDTFREGEYNYIVMEYLEGGTAETLLDREGRQPVSRILEMMIQIADALGYAHDLNIIHRDLKPSNILLTQDYSPRLADFGVAHFASQAERLTAAYAVVGTPAYICPEGYDTSFFTPAEDVWSLGVTMFELLTGTLPFIGRTPEHIRHAVQNSPVPDIRSIRPDIPKNLSDLIFKMLERDPSRRLQDGRAIKNALTEILASIKPESV